MKYYKKEYYKKEYQTVTAMALSKPEDENYLLIAAIKLENKTVDVVVINGYPFTKESLSFKSSGKFNWSKTIELFVWAYHKDIMLELANMDIDKIINPSSKTN